MVFEKTYTISEKEWERVKKIHQSCIEEKISLQEENEDLQRAVENLQRENSKLTLENTNLKRELKTESTYIGLLTNKVNELLDIIQMKSKNITALDLRV